MEKELTPSDKLSRAQIAAAVTRLWLERKVSAGQTIKVAFLDSAPDYAATSLDSYWAKYFPQIDPATADQTWKKRIGDEYNNAHKIQTTFAAVPTSERQALFDQAIEQWQTTYANVTFALVDIAQADVRIGLSDNVSINFAPGALPEAPMLGDVYLNLSLSQNSPGLLGDQALTTMFHEFGHVLGLSHGDDGGQLPAEYGCVQYGVMGAAASVGHSFKPLTPLLFDALGLQSIGLLKTSVNETDNYVIAPNTGRLIIDSGGTDTLNRSASDDEIDLRATDFNAGKVYFSSIVMGDITGTSGDLGIKLDPTKKAAFGSIGSTNPYAASGSTPPSNITASVTEGGGKALKLYLNGPAKAGDTITLAATGSGAGQCSAILGDSTVPLDGAVITLKEGQTEVDFAVVNTQDISANVDLSLKASYTSTDPSGAQTVTSSNQASIALVDSGEVGNTYNGDYAVKARIKTVPNNSLPARQNADGTLVAVTFVGDKIFETDAQHNLLAGSLVDSHDQSIGAGNDQIDGGEGRFPDHQRQAVRKCYRIRSYMRLSELRKRHVSVSEIACRLSKPSRAITWEGRQA